MKNATTFFLLFIFSFNLGAPYIIFKIQQYQLRREIIHKIKNGIAEKDLTIITITSDKEKSIIWKDVEEFIYEGVLYDVVKVGNIDKKTTVYQCIYDFQEANLIAKYNKSLQKKQKNKNNRAGTAKVFKFFQKINPLPQKEDCAFSQKKIESNFIYHENYSSLSLEILSPPPKQVL